MKIYANCIVHNEENFVWFSVMSVIDYVDKVLIWDTGSTDKTVEVIKEIIKEKGEKIDFKEVGPVDKYEFTKMRQKMLEESHCDWILVLDGDEIWWEDSIKKLIKVININSNKVEGFVMPMVVAIGDIYHFQEELAGRYEIVGKKGHYNLRAINKSIPGLHVDRPYGEEGYFDKDNNEIQKREKIVFLNSPYLHVTHLKRSTRKRNYNKYKYEIGKSFSKNFKYPEIFYTSLNPAIPNPWQKMSKLEYLRAKMMTPLKKLKRRLIYW